MVYDWGAHEETCRRLYVEEKQTLEEICEYLRKHHDFTPSSRALQYQFRVWNFPPKQRPAYKNEALVDRIRELWEANVAQKEMLRVLHDEGFDLSMRELTRVRNKNRLLLRQPSENSGVRNHKNRRKTQNPEPPGASQRLSSSSAETVAGSADSATAIPLDLVVEARAVIGGDAAAVVVGEEEEQQQQQQQLDPVRQAGREQRKRELAADSAEKWATKKRRRRTRGWAGLPADPPGPPRFPSETTLQESREILGLGEELYRDFRQRFERICAEAGVLKKTVAGPERWDAAKEQLVREMPHLRSLLWVGEGEGEGDGAAESKNLAVDVICCDVTKRMRTVGKHMSLAEARNLLGLNPDEAREIRLALYQILADGEFEGKIVSGEERWNELKQQWISQCDLLRDNLAAEIAGRSREGCAKAVDTLARDGRKRYRDDVVRGRNKRPQTTTARAVPPVAEADPGMDDQVLDEAGFEPLVEAAQMAPPPMEPAPPIVPASPGGRRGMHGPTNAHQTRFLPGGGLSAQPDLSSIDPGLESSMLMAADRESAYIGHHLAQYTAPQPAQLYHQQPRSSMNNHNHNSNSNSNSNTIAVYFRLHPASALSAVPAVPAMWVATLSSRSVEELRGAAVIKFPGHVCLGVEGLVRDGKGGEVPLQIHGDAELEAYLAHIQEAQGAPTFSVHLVRAWDAE